VRQAFELGGVPALIRSARTHLVSYDQLLTPPKLSLDFSLFPDTLNGVEIHALPAGACFRFSFLMKPFRPCTSKTTKIVSFRINHL